MDINSCTCSANEQKPGDWHDPQCPNFLAPDSDAEIASESETVTEPVSGKDKSNG